MKNILTEVKGKIYAGKGEDTVWRDAATFYGLIFPNLLQKIQIYYVIFQIYSSDSFETFWKQVEKNRPNLAWGAKAYHSSNLATNAGI